MKKATRRWCIGITAFLSLAFVFSPARYMQSVADGLSLFVFSVLPAMFPFFFFSNLLTALGVAEDLSRYLKKPVRAMFRAPEVGGYVFLMSILSGYPVGARLVADCYERGYVDGAGAKALVAFTSTSGPLFVLGTVGQGMFGSAAIGAALLGAHYAGAILNGFFYRRRSAAFPPCAALPRANGNDFFADGLISAVRSTLIVGGWVALFNMVIVLLGDIGLIPAVGALAQKAGMNGAAAEGFFAGWVEVTRGALNLSKSGAPLVVTLPLTAALVSFGGLSVTLQSLTFLGRAEIKAGYYLLTKLTHAAFSAAIAALLGVVWFAA